MTQHELIGVMNTKMLQAVRYRERINDDSYPEQHGYWHGVFRAYEEMIQTLLMMDIRPSNPESPEMTPPS